MHTPSSAEVELSQFLGSIEDGSVSLTPEQEPQDVYAANVGYSASNGWRIVVYNDANEWDYIDSITTSDGRFFNLDALHEMPAVHAYEPSGEIAWTRYGIPGHCCFRCKGCGTRLTKPKGGSMRPPFLCVDCQAKSLISTVRSTTAVKSATCETCNRKKYAAIKQDWR